MLEEHQTLLDQYGGYSPGRVRIELIGPNQRPRRFIHAPHFQWTNVPGCASYRVVVWDSTGCALDVTTSEPGIDLGYWWDKIPVGTVRMVILGIDATNSLL